MATDILQLENLYKMYKNQIYTLCIRLTRSKMQADDLFGETWVRVAEKMDNLQKGKNPANWIYTVCLNIYRKSAPKWKDVDVSNDDIASEIFGTAHDANADKIMIEQETVQHLQKAVSALDDKYRIPIILFYFRELSYKEISKIMNLHIGTVKFRLNHAKKLLKKEMEVLW